MQAKDFRRYYSLKQFLTQKFGQKVYKISIDAGFSCPNRDGTVGTSGCIFCSSKGSGDFAGSVDHSIREQLCHSPKGIEELSSKHSINKYIAYFQAYTNTYGPIDQLRKKYYEALSVPGVVGIAIATRPDCLEEEVLELLYEIKQKTYVWIELGLQTMHDKTADIIHRGYPLSCFEKAVSDLNQINIDVVCHLIFGLPGESRINMLDSVKYISSLKVQGVKLHLLHVLESTILADMYKNNLFQALTLEEYVNLVVDALELLPPEVVIHRLTGDGPKDMLIAPEWSKNKRNVLNCIEKELIARNSWQGKFYHS